MVPYVSFFIGYCYLKTGVVHYNSKWLSEARLLSRGRNTYTLHKHELISGLSTHRVYEELVDANAQKKWPTHLPVLERLLPPSI